MVHGRRSKKFTARDLPARIRVVDAPFPIAISAPSLELGNPHGGRCGHALANAGQDTRALQAWLGHKNIQHTVR
jgi:integrase